MSRYRKYKTNLDFTEARDSEWQWHQLCRMQVCTSLQADNHASTPPLSFLQAGCPSCRPTNGVKALKPEDQRRRVKLFWPVVLHLPTAFITAAVAARLHSSQQQREQARSLLSSNITRSMYFTLDTLADVGSVYRKRPKQKEKKIN